MRIILEAPGRRYPIIGIAFPLGKKDVWAFFALTKEGMSIESEGN
jgi:hypothetical protein